MATDNLRDRIADLLWRTEEKSWEDQAQAIIDEFGLTVEIEPGHDPRECGCSSRAYPAESRVVGKWEVEQ